MIGLVRALDSLQRDFASTSCEVKFRHWDVPEAIADDTALCAFRITQEALNNALKHGRAKHVSIDLFGSAFGLELSVVDDGIGFDPGRATDEGGLGLVSMRERVASLHGVLDIQSAPGSGTRLTVQLPLHSQSLEGPA